MSMWITPQYIPLAGHDIYILAMRARGAAGYVCFGRAMPRGTFYKKCIGSVDYSVEVAFAAFDSGQVRPVDDHQDASHIYFRITPLNSAGEPAQALQLQTELREQLEVLLSDESLPSFAQHDCT